jgi:hypothetical protein
MFFKFVLAVLVVLRGGLLVTFTMFGGESECRGK